MADTPTQKATVVPKIGELIDQATGIKYEAYSADQKIGQTKENPYVDYEAITAFAINHPDLKNKAFDLLKDQALIRESAINNDVSKELNGETLSGLKPLAMENGRVKMGGLFMSEAPTEAGIRASDKDKPEKLESDLAKYKIAQGILKDPTYLDAEGVSNATNVGTDVRGLINGKAISPQAKKTIEEGLKADAKMVNLIEHNDSMLFFRKSRTHHLENKVEKMMDAAATTAGISLDNPVYQHYKNGMHKGIDAGMEAAKVLHDTGVKPTNAGITQATPVAAVHKGTVGKTAGS